jgi:hypothetical protein
MMRGMAGAGAEVQVERLVRGDLLGVGDELDGLVGQVLGQVVALFGGAGRLDLVVVVDQLSGIIELLLVGRSWPVRAGSGSGVLGLPSASPRAAGGTLLSPFVNRS